MGISLETLIVDESAVARDQLASALAPYLRFTRAGELLLEPRFDDLAAELRVLCVLLALQALRLLDLRETDQATPAEIVSISGMPPGTVRPKLAGLLKKRLVAKDGARYSLPVHAARRAIELLTANSG